MITSSESKSLSREPSSDKRLTHDQFFYVFLLIKKLAELLVDSSLWREWVKRKTGRESLVLELCRR